MAMIADGGSRRAHVPARESVLHRLAQLLGPCLVILGAAIRVSSAVKGRHEPAAADLALLGVTDKLPRSF